MENGSAKDLIDLASEDIKESLDIFLNVKSLQVVDTTADILLLQVPNMASPAEVNERLTQFLRIARNEAISKDPESFPPDEYNKDIDIGVTRARAAGTPYDNKADPGPRRKYHLECSAGNEEHLFNLMQFAIHHKLLSQYFGEYAKVVKVERNSEEFIRDVMQDIDFLNSLSHQRVPGLMNPFERVTLEGVTEDTETSKLSVMDVFRQIEVVGDEGITKKLLCCYFDRNRHTWFTCYLNDTKAKEYFTQWISLSAMNVFQRLIRNGFKKKDILKLIKKAYLPGTVHNVSKSKYDSTKRLAVPVRQSYVSNSLAHLGIPLGSGLTKEEKRLVGIEVPDGATLTDILESNLTPEDDRFVSNEQMSVRSFAKGADGKTVRSSAPIGATVATQARDESSSIASAEIPNEDGVYEKTEDDVAVRELLHQVTAMNTSQRLQYLGQLWKNYGALFCNAVESGSDWGSLLNTFKGHPRYPVQVFSYLLSLASDMELRTFHFHEHLVSFRQHFLSDYSYPPEDSQYEAMSEGEVSNCDGEGFGSDAMSEDGRPNGAGEEGGAEDPSLRSESQDGSEENEDEASLRPLKPLEKRYLSLGDFSQECANSANQGLYTMLLQLIRSQIEILPDSVAINMRMVALVNGAKALLHIEETITPDNATRFGNSSDSLKVVGIGPRIADRLHLFTTHGFLPGSSLSIDPFKFTQPTTVWQSYFNSRVVLYVNACMMPST